MKKDLDPISMAHYLSNCANKFDCEVCPYSNTDIADCTDSMMNDAAEMIKRISETVIFKIPPLHGCVIKEKDGHDEPEDGIETDIEFVRINVKERALYEGLAEEAAEAAHAALKVIRAVLGENPTPVTEREAMKKLREEVSDFCMYAYLLGMLPTEREVKTNAKWKRFADRIRERLRKVSE